MTDGASDERYLSLLVDAIRTSSNYRPKFGRRGAGLELDGFIELYGSDPFYSWMGLDSPVMYAAHKAAGGITSIYRQLGIGVERLFRALLMDSFHIDEAQANWEYEVPAEGGRTRKLKLDGRLDIGHLTDSSERDRLDSWLDGFKKKLDVQSDVRGAVFEVRQGYKSKDSKRQNADLSNAANAYTQRYLPVLTVLSLQLDDDLRVRYEAAKWGVLTGSIQVSDPYVSTYAFAVEVLDYDLAAFFDRNAKHLRSEVTRVVESLLAAQ